MREIKLRAWDGVKLSYSKTEIFDDSVNFRFEHFDVDCVEPVLERFTGFFDKNGKEIWERDIVIVEKSSKGIVIFIECEALFCIATEKHRIGFYQISTDHIEVIGNIHEEEQQCTSATVE